MELTEFLDDHGIEYWDHGKNISPGWINIQCIFCDDHSNHLGIRLSDLRVSCWRCGGHKINKLIMGIAECDYQKSKVIYTSLRSSLGAGYLSPLYSTASSSELSKMVSLPQECTKKFPKDHIAYLKNRGFNPREIIKKYKLQAVHTIGRYKFRIIIPIYMNKKLVSFTSRDITDEQALRYKGASQSECILNPKEVIYNYDTLSEGSDAILVEGPIDVWKLGDGTISILGITHTRRQIIAIKKKKIRNMFILFDRGKKEIVTAKKLARILAPLVKSVEVVTLNKAKDPGELKVEEAALIKRQLGL